MKESEALSGEFRAVTASAGWLSRRSQLQETAGITVFDNGWMTISVRKQEAEGICLPLRPLKYLLYLVLQRGSVADRGDIGEVAQGRVGLEDAIRRDTKAA